MPASGNVPWVNGPSGSTPLEEDALNRIEQALANSISYNEADNRYPRKGDLAFNVKDYGAVGDGVTDNTDAIHALRDVAGTGASIRFPPGTYLVRGLGLNVANQRWTLDEGAVIKMSPGGSGNVVNLRASGVTLEGPGTIDGNKANVASGGAGVQAYSATGMLTDVSVRRLTVINTTGRGVHLRNCSRGRVKGCTVIGSNSDGIYADVDIATTTSLTDIMIVGNHVDRSAQGAGVADGGIKVHGSSSPNTQTIHRVKILGNTVLMPTSPTNDAAICIETWHGCPGADITGNQTAGGSMGVSIDTSDNASATGNTIIGPSYVGIEVPISSYVTVTGNTIDGAGLATYGVWVDNTPSAHASIVGNTIKGCTANAVHINGTTTGKAAIVGNAINHSGTGAALRLDAPLCTAGMNTHSGTSPTASSVVSDCQVWGDTDTSGLRFNLFDVNANFRQIAGTGNPNGTYGGARGSLFIGRNAAPGATLFTKDTGTGTTWVPVVTYRAKAGAPTDADFETTPADGVQVVDTTSNRLYIRVGGAWKYTALT